MNKLILRFRPVEHPYSQETSRFPSEAWGEVTFELVGAEQRMILFQTTWSYTPIVFWFGEHKHHILHEDVNNFSALSKGNCIAEKIRLFFADDENFSEGSPYEKTLDEIIAFRSRHRIYFDGINLERDIFLGLNNGDYEVSWIEDDMAKSYIVDLKGFLAYMY